MGETTQTPDGADLLPAVEAARLAGVSHPTITGWISSGRLTSVQIGRQRFVRRRDLELAQRIAHAGEVISAWRGDPGHAGQRLRRLREVAGLSQVALAAQAGVSHEAVSLLERGRRSPQAKTMHKLAQALGVAPERFIAHDPIGLSLLTTAEAAVRLGVPMDRVRVWLHNGELAGHKVSGRWRAPAVAVAELARSGRLRGESRRLDPRFRGKVVRAHGA